MLSSVLGGATHRDTNANKHILDNDNCTNNTSSSSSSLIHYNSPKRKVARLVGCFHNNGESKRPLRMIGEEALLLRPANWNNGSALSALTGGGSSGSSHSPLSHSSSHHHRAIVSTSTRVLDAPDLMDDYYLNLLRSAVTRKQIHHPLDITCNILVNPTRQHSLILSPQY